MKLTEECEEAFQTIKRYLGDPSMLSKPKEGKNLYVYLAVFEHAVSSIQFKEENAIQWPIYYVNKPLQSGEVRYSEIEKLALTLVISTRKLHPYFQAHPIKVLTSHQLHKILQKPDALKWLTKQAIELREFNIKFKPCTSINGQALVDFIAKFVNEEEETQEVYVEQSNQPPQLDKTKTSN